jgi:hypothetical protein
VQLPVSLVNLFPMPIREELTTNCLSPTSVSWSTIENEAMRPDVSSLKEFTNARLPELHMYYHEFPEKKLLLLPAIAYIWMRCYGVSFYEFNFQKVLQSFPPAFLEQSTFLLVDLLVDAFQKDVFQQYVDNIPSHLKSAMSDSSSYVKLCLISLFNCLAEMSYG